MKRASLKLAIWVLLSTIAAAWTNQAFAQATILPPGETCFQATTGITGMLGSLTGLNGGSGYVSATYGGVPLTGGSGSGATANITISGGIVTSVAVLNPGSQYVIGDTLSASSSNLGGSGSGFFITVGTISINSSLAGGSVAFYIPNTSTLKQTWQNAAQTILNSNPVPLDLNGCALIYGQGSYRQVLKDSLGNTVWDQITTDTSASNSVFWAGLASGTANAITVTDTSFNGTDGSIVNFTAAFTNTGPATFNPSSYFISAPPIEKDTASGPVALAGGEIVATGTANPISLIYRSGDNAFHILNNVLPTTPSPYGFNACSNLSIAASVNSGILTITFNAADGSIPSVTNQISCAFRDSTIASGTPVTASVTSALSINTNSVGATLGSSNATPFRFWIVLFNNGGTIVPALINCSKPSQIFPLVEDIPQSTTPIGSGATNAGIFYTPNGTTVTSSAFRIVGYLSYESGLATAGTYSSVPTNIQLFGPGIKKPGEVVQVITPVFGTLAVTTFTTGTTATNVTASITPFSAVDLIRYAVTTTSGNTNSTTNINQLYRNSTAIGVSYRTYMASTNVAMVLSFFGYDAPYSASPVTYVLKASTPTGTGSIPAQNTDSATEVLEEIMGAGSSPANDNINPGIVSLTG